ncbi:MAG: 4Fe-4S dicluster domain-containing protein [Euryarchaeota archaeon]|nr:4Fe-4S dicluster domain-containing protein [Euryarchaeota archaeon]
MAGPKAGTVASSTVRPDSPTFWKEVLGLPGGEALATCIQCNTCTSSCPVEALEPEFNIRRLIARIKLGLREDVLSDEALWACARCFACVARCPKHVRPGDIVEAVRHIALGEEREGPGPRHARAFVESIRDGGRIHEARVTLESLRLAGLLREGWLPARMAWRGKAPRLRRRPLKSVPEIRALLDAAEEGA